MARSERKLPDILVMTPTEVQSDNITIWRIPESVELARVLSVAGNFTAAATANDRYMRLGVRDKNEKTYCRIVGADPITANLTRWISFVAGGGANVLTDDEQTIPIGDLIVAGGDSLRWGGLHANDDPVSDGLLRLATFLF